MPEEPTAVLDNPAAPEATPAVASPEPAPVIPEGVDPRSYLENPLLKADVTPEPEADPQPNPEREPQPAASEPGGEPKLLAGKFESPEKLEEAYTALETKLGAQGSEIGQLRRQQQEFDQLREQVLSAANNPQPTPDNPQGTEPAPAQTAEEMIQAEFNSWDEAKQDAFMADFYADGPKAMAGAFTPILGKAVEQMKAEVNQFKTEMTNQVEPFIQERQFNEQVAQTGEVISAFAEAHPDMEGIKPAMQEVYSADPEFYDSLPADKAIQSLYNAAKAQNAEAVENKPSLEDYLNDPGAQAKFAESDAVKQIVLSGHAEAIKNGRPPVVVGAQPGGASPAVPPEQITTTDEASKASLGLFKRLGMRG